MGRSDVSRVYTTADARFVQAFASRGIPPRLIASAMGLSVQSLKNLLHLGAQVEGWREGETLEERTRGFSNPDFDAALAIYRSYENGRAAFLAAQIENIAVAAVSDWRAAKFLLEREPEFQELKPGELPESEGGGPRVVIYMPANSRGPSHKAP